MLKLIRDAERAVENATGPGEVKEMVVLKKKYKAMQQADVEQAKKGEETLKAAVDFHVSAELERQAAQAID